MSRANELIAADISLSSLDRLAVAYLVLPLLVFILGWFRWWVALPAACCIVWAARSVAARRQATTVAFPITRLQLLVAVGIGSAWALLGGTDHAFFANTDWRIRDAVLHDLVVSPWPVGYGPIGGSDSMLRAPLGFYMPAAVIGKIFDLGVAHFAMLLWTAAGASLFLALVSSLTSSRPLAVATVVTVLVMFSGMDIIGCALNDPSGLWKYWRITDHLEWWAGRYQYSSMTTQLFWVPNHALGGWLLVALLYRCRGTAAFMKTLPVLVVAVASWSPFAAIGAAPFAAAAVFEDIRARRAWNALDVENLLPAVAVAAVIGAYLALGAGTIQHSVEVFDHGNLGAALLLQLRFFLIEAGLLGGILLVLRPDIDVMIAIFILAVLPFFSFGPANDLVMRVSIPALTVLAISVVRTLCDTPATPFRKSGKVVLVVLLLIGAVTPADEIARAVLFPRWPVDANSSLVAADCGGRPAHYVAKLQGQLIVKALRDPHDVEMVGGFAAWCYQGAP